MSLRGDLRAVSIPHCNHLCKSPVYLADCSSFCFSQLIKMQQNYWLAVHETAETAPCKYFIDEQKLDILLLGRNFLLIIICSCGIFCVCWDLTSQDIFLRSDWFALIVWMHCLAWQQAAAMNVKSPRMMGNQFWSNCGNRTLASIILFNNRALWWHPWRCKTSYQSQFRPALWSIEGLLEDGSEMKQGN